MALGKYKGKYIVDYNYIAQTKKIGNLEFFKIPFSKYVLLKEFSEWDYITSMYYVKKKDYKNYLKWKKEDKNETK
jgi:hypothetical protein